ncbi:MAG: hypothetical protein R3E44_08460 [Paracoccaceae bacterium]
MAVSDVLAQPGMGARAEDAGLVPVALPPDARNVPGDAVLSYAIDADPPHRPVVGVARRVRLRDGAVLIDHCAATADCESAPVMRVMLTDLLAFYADLEDGAGLLATPARISVAHDKDDPAATLDGIIAAFDSLGHD